MIDEHFHLKMWVCVREDFDIVRLMKEIYTLATYGSLAELKVDRLVEDLQKTLEYRKFLLVLDDLLNEKYNKWINLPGLLGTCARGSKVLAIGRNEQIAAIMGTVPTYFLEQLSHEDCLSLFLKSACTDDAETKYPYLAAIGDEIVKKCGGVPLIVKTLGTLLHQNTNEHDWLLIRDHDVWRLELQGNNILPLLKLGYTSLPSHLRRCFAYCSLFPKGYIFTSDCLISHWMAVGFLAAGNENEELEDVGLKYLKELLFRCFFVDFEDHGYYFTFKMHALMHDLAMEVAQRECKTVDLRIGCDDMRNARHLSFIDIGYGCRKVSSIPRNLHTIFMQNLGFEHAFNSFIDKGLPYFKHLRLLRINGKRFWKLPDSICALKHLRFLDLNWNSNMEELPEAICRLQSLQILRLLGSDLQKLPSNMRNMISLRYLEITTREMLVPENGIEFLSSLQHLHLSDCYNSKYLPDGIGNLTSLRTLILEGCRQLLSLPRSIKNLQRLEKLVIHSCPELNLKMDMHKEEELSLNLKIFMICELGKLVDIPQLILQGSANTLEYMRIEECHYLQALPAWLPSLTSLQKLEIVSCRRLSHLPYSRMQNLTALRELKIRNSFSLE